MANPNEKRGPFYGLMSAFGWYQSSPVNLTDNEAKAKPGVLTVESEMPTSQYRAQGNPEARWNDMKAMAESELVGPLMEIYAEEATQPDINKGRCLWYECDDSEVEEDLNTMLDRVNSEDQLAPIIMGVAGTGNEYRRVLYNEQGVQQLVGITATGQQMPVKRLWDKTTRRLIGFKWESEKPREEDVLYQSDKAIFPPWAFIHFRRLHRSDTEYGTALLDSLYPLWRKLEQSIDQMVTYRRHTMPTRHAILLDVQGQDQTDSMESVHLFAHMMRQQHAMTSMGLESRYNPPALESVLYIPLRGSDDKTTITKMDGDKDVPDIPDIEALLKQLYGGARIPKSYVGMDEKGGIAQASLVSQDIRFARVIRTIRRVLVSGFYRLAQIHLILKGKNPSNYKIKVKMSRISSIEEEVNVAVLEKQANLARTIADICQQLEIPNREIIDLVFREYLSVPRYFIDIAKLGVSVNRALGLGGDGGGGGGMGGGGMGGFGGIEDGGMDDMGDGDLDGGGEAGDLDALGGEPDGGGNDPGKLMASARKVSLLTEVKTSARDRSVLLSAIRGLQPSSRLVRAVTESESKKKKATVALAKALEDVLNLKVSKKSSLIEDYTGIALATEPVYGASSRTSLKESIGKDTSLNPTSIEVYTEPQGTVSEAVQLKRRLKAA